MKSAARIYDVVSETGFLCLAGAALSFCCGSVLYDVGLRTAGLRPPVWTSAATEWAMLLLTMAIAPYLVRHHGHIRIDTLARALPASAAALLYRGTNAVAAAVSIVVVAIAVRLALDAQVRGELDIRSIEMPRWVLFAAIAGGFGMCAVEFLRHALSQSFVQASDGTGAL